MALLKRWEEWRSLLVFCLWEQRVLTEIFRILHSFVCIPAVWPFRVHRSIRWRLLWLWCGWCSNCRILGLDAHLRWVGSDLAIHAWFGHQRCVPVYTLMNFSEPVIWWIALEAVIRVYVGHLRCCELPRLVAWLMTSSISALTSWRLRSVRSTSLIASSTSVSTILLSPMFLVDLKKLLF